MRTPSARFLLKNISTPSAYMGVETVKCRSLVGFAHLGSIKLFEQQVVMLINEGYEV